MKILVPVKSGVNDNVKVGVKSDECAARQSFFQREGDTPNC